MGDNPGLILAKSTALVVVFEEDFGEHGTDRIWARVEESGNRIHIAGRSGLACALYRRELAALLPYLQAFAETGRLEEKRNAEE